MVTDLRKAAEQALEALDEAANILTWDGFASAATALREALAKPDVSEGWKLVPVEPTPEMLRTYTGGAITEAGFKWCRHQWAAMLAAAPQPKDTP